MPPDKAIPVKERVWGLGELSAYIQARLRDDAALSNINVRGEITSLHFHRPSGHTYFSLREGNVVLHCVWFKNQKKELVFKMEDGLEIIVTGNIDIYPGRSQYQLMVMDVAAAGIGTLYQAFEQLKKKLSAEGLFEESRKKRLPEYPQRIGLVTSPVGAARRDVEDNLRMRYPLAELIIANAQVQGEGAAISIRNALSDLLKLDDLDVIIITRGGGSFEDLFAFNDEALVRDVAAAEIPIVSGVGHQKDFTIVDFVADMRAGTPSHAVEICTPDIAMLKEGLTDLKSSIQRLVVERLEMKRLQVQAAERGTFFRKAEGFIERKMQELDDYERKMELLIDTGLKALKTQVAHLKRSLELVDPQSIVRRGFAICYNADGQPIVDIEKIEQGDRIRVSVRNGAIDALVEGKEKSGGADF